MKLSPKTIKYRSYKTFNNRNFIHELNQKLIKSDISKTDDSYSKLSEIFSEILEKHPQNKKLLEETRHLL